MANRLVTCPYDEAHKVKESRFQLHITKCRMNHLNSKEGTFTCPFNATHVYPVQERSYHLSRCPDRGIIDRMMTAPINQHNPFKGRTAVPNYSEPISIESDEVWDVEDTFEIRPIKDAPLGAIVEPEPLSKPASRRQLYRDLHQLPSELDKRSNDAKAPSEMPAVPRQPKQPSQAERNFEEQGTNVKHLGLGRGKPPASRIAANIFPRPSQATNKAPAWGNYNSVTTGMASLNLGRGTSNIAPTLNDDNFPALGLGRGAANPPKRTDFKAPGVRW